MNNYMIFRKENNFGAVELSSEDFEQQTKSWKNEGYVVVCERYGHEGEDSNEAIKAWYEEQEESPKQTKKCPECLAEIPAGARKCRYCASKQKGDGSWLIAIAILIGMGFVFSLFSSNNSNEGAKEKSPLCDSISSLHILQANKKLGTNPTASIVKTVFEKTAISDRKYGLYAYYKVDNGKFLEVIYITGIASFCSEITKDSYEKSVLVANLAK